MAKISVIIPVYNGADTLDRCVESVVNQTYGDLEIILVENGSTDGSYELCEKWARRDNRIRAERSEKGVSKARNRGMELMTGEYFAFVDADDYIDVTTYEKCLSRAENGADMVFFLTNSVQDGVVTEYRERNIDKVVSGDIRWFFFRGADGVRTGTIRTLFRTDVHGKLRYDESMSYSEDFIFMLEAMDEAQKRELVDEYLYYNVNFHNRSFVFARKYKGRVNFYDSARFLAEKAEIYLKKYGCEDILYAPKFDGLILLINAIVGSEEKPYKKIKEFTAEPYWKEANNETAYRHYLKVVADCSFVTKFKAFLVRKKMYRTYIFAAKFYAKIHG